VYKCGNPNDMGSRFNFLRRWRLERQLNYSNMKHPIFLYAYRAFIDALAKGDKPTLQKMCEKQLYRRLVENQTEVERMGFAYYLVADKIQMKMKLLDTRVISGVYLDRSKNLSAQYYEVQEEKDKTVYTKKSK
jgi:hypothetical protein